MSLEVFTAENTNEEDISVVIARVITALDHTRESIWALYIDEDKLGQTPETALHEIHTASVA